MAFGDASQQFNFNFNFNAGASQPSTNTPFAFNAGADRPGQERKPARRIAAAKGAKGRNRIGLTSASVGLGPTNNDQPKTPAPTINFQPNAFTPVNSFQANKSLSTTFTPTNSFQANAFPAVHSEAKPVNPVNAQHLDRDWLLNRLQQLNTGVGGPSLTQEQIYDLCTNVVEQQIRQYEGRPIAPELLQAIGPVIAQALSTAKTSLLAAGSGLGDGQVGIGVIGEEAKDMAGTPQLGQYLNYINGFIGARNEEKLCDFILLEPPFSDSYQTMIRELQTTYPKGNEAALEQKCTQQLPKAVAGDDGSLWTSFIKFMVQYLCYLRDVSADPNRYLETYNLLSELQQRANSALGHSTLGHMILLTVVGCARLICRLAIGLDKQPELIAHLKRSGGAGEEGAARETLPERAANTLRAAFVTCLNDRVSGLSADGKPEGKKRGIYLIANLCLKILFQCRKTRNATQIFENIYNLSPPLSSYPKSQRVTYLYYLGRFLWQNNHFYRAQVVLQEAYNESSARPECMRQRRHVLIYLIASNIVLGRFPSQALLERPEAAGLAEKFLPICSAIKQGNLAAFRQHLDLDGPHAQWFLHFRVLLQLRNRCEVLVWRSLVRRIFNLAGTRPDTTNTRAAPTVALNLIVDAFQWLEQAAATAINGDYTDPDFSSVDYGDTTPPITLMAIESKVSSLIDQGLSTGFISHRLGKFAVTGVQRHGGDVLKAGFPNVWEVFKAKAGGEEIPGWKKQEARMGGGMGGFGGVVNSSGLRPIGAMA